MNRVGGHLRVQRQPGGDGGAMVTVCVDTDPFSGCGRIDTTHSSTNAPQPQTLGDLMDSEDAPGSFNPSQPPPSLALATVPPKPLKPRTRAAPRPP